MSLNKKAPFKILVVKNRAYGDSVIGLSTLSYIKTVFPNAKVTYGLPGWIIPLYKGVKSPADDTLNIDLNSFGDWSRLFFELREKKFDLILELHQSGRTGKFLRLFSFITGTPFYFHNHHTNVGNLLYEGKRAPNIQRDLNGVWSAFFEMGLVTREEIPHYLDFCPKLSPLKRLPRKRGLVMGVVAGRPTKMWPLSYYHELAWMLYKHDPKLEILIPLSLIPVDWQIRKEMETMGFPPNVRVEQLSIGGLPELVAPYSHFVGNDTGLKHLCVALGLKTLTFFGPEEPLEWHPYDTQEHPYLFVEPLECRTQTSHYCAIPECSSMICLNQFRPKQIFDMLMPQLSFDPSLMPSP